MNLLLTKRGEIFENTEGKLMFICCICDTINLTLEDVENHLKNHISIVIRKDDENDDVDDGTGNVPVVRIKAEGIKSDEQQSDIIRAPVCQTGKTSHLTLACSHCSERFPCSGLRDQHIASIHTYSTSPFICCKCKLGFSNERFYMRHMTAHKKTYNIDCPGCGHVMSTINELVKHLDGKDECVYDIVRVNENLKLSAPITIRPFRGRLPTSNHKPEIYRCDKCDRVYPRRVSIKRHLLTHLDEKPLKCHICGYGFTIAHSLELHLRRHQQIKPFNCSYCVKTFVTLADMNIHIRSHTGERKFICTSCGMRFSTSSNLSRHTRSIHNQEKNHNCMFDGCGKSFFAKRALMFHMRMHTGEKPLICDICDDRFALPKALKRHIKRLHKTN